MELQWLSMVHPVKMSYQACLRYTLASSTLSHARSSSLGHSLNGSFCFVATAFASLDMPHCAVDGLCIPRLAGVHWATMPYLLCCPPVDTDNLQ